MIPRLLLRSLAAVAALIVASVSATAQGAPPATASALLTDSMVVSTEWLAGRLNDPRVVVVEVTMDDKPRTAGIPGSRAIAYRRLAESRDGISTELPSVDSIRALAEGLGISDDSHVVVYAHEAPMATRLLMSLDYLGLTRLSYLDGGLARWQSERRAATVGTRSPTRGSISTRPRPDAVVTADWITPRIGKPGLALIDTRTDGEYNGTGNRSGMPSAGHLEGARQLEWQTLFDTDNGLQLKPRSELRRLFDERVQGGDTVVTYCWVGYRASATYFVARLLGYDVRLYDGSYQDWQRRQLPTRAGTTP